MQDIPAPVEQLRAERGRPSIHDGGTATGQHELAVQLGELARSLHQETPGILLETVVAAAIELVPGVEDGSLSIVTGRKKVESQAPSSELPRQVDAFQMELREGPCLSAVYEERTVRVPDMAAEERWPRFARRAAEAGVGSMLAFQLYVEGDNLGAMNLYSSQTDAFGDESEHIGLIVGSHAAIALADAQKVGQLHEAVESRDMIGQAKGILMERYKITGHEAFLLLAKASQQTNKKLADVADQLVNSGELKTGNR